jgi:hypothetical protein
MHHLLDGLTHVHVGVSGTAVTEGVGREVKSVDVERLTGGMKDSAEVASTIGGREGEHKVIGRPVLDELS